MKVICAVMLWRGLGRGEGGVKEMKGGVGKAKSWMLCYT